MNFLIVDDDFGSRGGMAQTLRDAYPSSKVQEATSISTAIEILKRDDSIQLVLLDLNVEDSKGILTLTALKEWCEANDVNPRIVVVSGGADYDDTLIPRAIEHCATGFITKGISEGIFISAIQLTLSGCIYIPEKYLIARRSLESNDLSPPKESIFTQREIQVARKLIQGLTYKQIARKLEEEEPGRQMSDHTVRVHIQRIAWKLRLGSESGGDGLSAKSAVLTAFAQNKLSFPVDQ